MKLHVEGTDIEHRITGYGPGWVEVNRVRHEAPVALIPGMTISPWPVTQFESLSAEHFNGLIAYAPDVVLLGTGAKLRFPHPRLVAGLAAIRVGVEAMDTAAACRTYNVLAGEGRKVIAILLLDT